MTPVHVMERSHRKHSFTEIEVGEQVVEGSASPVPESKSTDDQIVHQVCIALASTGYRQLAGLQVYSDHGRITLQGSLPTQFLKQVAESASKSIDGVRDVDNDIRVKSAL